MTTATPLPWSLSRTGAVWSLHFRGEKLATGMDMQRATRLLAGLNARYLAAATQTRQSWRNR